MISRNLYNSPAFRHNGLPIEYCDKKSMPNIEKWALLQMVDEYKKLLLDSMWRSIIDGVNENIKNFIIKKTNSHANWMEIKSERERIMEKMRLQESVYTTEQHEIIVFLQAREYECRTDYNQNQKELFQERMKMASFLYVPLILCFKKLIKYHKCSRTNVPDCLLCQFKTGDEWNITKMLLWIFKQYPLKLPHDDFSNWSLLNIYRHPIISLGEERMQESISPLGELRKMSFKQSMSNVLDELLSIYDNYTAHFVIRILLHPTNRFDQKLAKVWDLKSTGLKILSFLVNVRTLQLICSKYNLPLCEFY